MKKYADYTNEILCATIQAGDDYAKEILIERNRRWVGKLAESFHKMLGMNVFATSAAVDDLIQAGNMAMLRAAERYEPDKAPAFLAFAKKIVLNAMRTEAKREYAESPLHLLKSEKVRAVLRLDDSYDEDKDSSLSECIPDDRELTPEAWYEREEKARSLWEALKALNPHDREFIMLRYGLGNRNGNTESLKGILPLTEAAKQAHISLSRAKRIEADALDFLKKHIEESNRRETVKMPELSSEARQTAEKLCEYITSHKRFHVGNIPFFACSADHPEVISGTADLIVVCKASFSGEQRNCSAYVPKWLISAESGQELCVRIDFPTAKAYLRLHIDNVPADYIIPGEGKSAPDLTEWLLFLAAELWQDDESEHDVLERLHVRRCLVRDICDAILCWHRRLGG